LRTSTHVTALLQCRQGGNFSPFDKAISYEWQVLARQIPDTEFICPVRLVMTTSVSWSILTFEDSLFTLQLTTLQGCEALVQRLPQSYAGMLQRLESVTALFQPFFVYGLVGESSISILQLLL
jgi:hypothetical protein